MITTKRVLGIIFCTVMAIVITMYVPLEVKANAIPATVLNDEDIFGDATVMIDVTAEFVGGTAWDFHYLVSNPGRRLAFMTFGLVNTLTTEVYAFNREDVVIDAASASIPLRAAPPVTSNSVFPIFNPFLEQGVNYGFTVRLLTEDIFAGGQSIAMRALDGAYARTIVEYEKPEFGSVAIPEPSTLLILGIGIVSIGFWSFRRRRT